MEIKKEIDNFLFGRKEIELTVKSNSSPKKEEMLKSVAKKFSVPEKNVHIEGIYGKFGSQEFKVVIKIYSSEEDKKRIETKKKKVKKQ